MSERLEIHGNEMVQRIFKEASAGIALNAESDHTSRKGKKERRERRKENFIKWMKKIYK
jgi:hypothetical protein